MHIDGDTWWLTHLEVLVSWIDRASANYSFACHISIVFSALVEYSVCKESTIIVYPLWLNQAETFWPMYKKDLQIDLPFVYLQNTKTKSIMSVM